MQNRPERIPPRTSFRDSPVIQGIVFGEDWQVDLGASDGCLSQHLDGIYFAFPLITNFTGFVGFLTTSNS